MTQSSLRTPVRSALCHIACRSTSVPVHSWALRSTSVPVLRHDTELAADSGPQRSVSRRLPVDFGPAAWVQGLLRDVCKPLRPDSDLHVLSVETVACRTLSGSVQAKDRQTLVSFSSQAHLVVFCRWKLGPEVIGHRLPLRTPDSRCKLVQASLDVDCWGRRFRVTHLCDS